MDRDQVLEEAGQVLSVAVFSSEEETAKCFGDMLTRVQGRDLLGVVIGWCDTVITTAGVPHGGNVHLVWESEEGTDADGPEDKLVEWSGQLIAARCSMDWNLFRALMLTVPIDRVNEYVFSLLMVCAISIRRELQREGGQ